LALCNLAEMLIWQGQLSGAIHRAEEALRIATEVDYRVGQVVARRIRAEAWLELGHGEQARVEMEQALAEAAEIDLTTEMIGARHGLARLAAARKDAADTEAHVSVARALAQKQDPERYAPALVALKAWACAFTGDVDDAARMLSQVERTLDKLQVPRRCQVMLSAAQAHAALGSTEDARRLASEAAGLAGSRSFRLWDLQARWLLAQVTEEPTAAAGWRMEAVDRARGLHEDLDPVHRDVYGARPEVAALLGERKKLGSGDSHGPVDS
jgi:ATP/maltotriose-dependent transcriptional regulator MalT